MGTSFSTKYTDAVNNYLKRGKYNNTFLLTATLLITTLGLSELFLRTPWLQMQWPVPYPVGGYQSVENRLHQLDKFVNSNGSVDCIFLGSSLAAVSIYPEAFEQAYFSKTGQSIKCFNAGISAGTASSFGPFAHILNNFYHPRLLILGTHPRSYDGRSSNELEEKFKQLPWVRYNLGEFSPEGWLLEYSFTYRYLVRLSEKIKSYHQQVQQQTDPRYVEARTVEGDYSPLIGFHILSPLYIIRDQRPQIKRTINEPYHLSQEDYQGFQQLIQLKSGDNKQIIIVEIPTPDQFFIDSTNAPEPTERQVFEGIIASYAQNNGVPFWITTDLNILPYTYYADGIHMYIEGSIIFSQWLGQQVGAATQMRSSQNEFPTSLIDTPPIKNPEIDRSYQFTFGMDKETFQKFQKHQSQFDMAPKQQTILNSRHENIDRSLLQNITGFFITWSLSVNDQNRPDYFDLLIIQNHMTYLIDLPESIQQTISTQRNSSELLNILCQSNISYILYTEKWDDPKEVPGQIFSSKPDYEFVKKWDFPPLHETYYLYHVPQCQN